MNMKLSLAGEPQFLGTITLLPKASTERQVSTRSDNACEARGLSRRNLNQSSGVNLDIGGDRIRPQPKSASDGA